LIRAALDGAVIETRPIGPPRGKPWRALETGRHTVAILAQEYPSFEYRVQPKPDRVVYRAMWRWERPTSTGCYKDYNSGEMARDPNLEWLKITYDGETNKIKSVELMS
jgi:hypothetical protein